MLNRRRFQYSLRSLLVFVLLASVFMAWFGARWRAARQQREAVAAIESLGGDVEYDYIRKWIASGATTGPPPDPPGPAWARSLLGDDFFAGVVRVGPGGRYTWSNGSAPAPFTDEWLEHIGKLSRLESLNLRGASHITDAGLAKLEGLTHLRRLELGFTSATDAGLAHVGKLSGLEVLDLLGTEATDAGLGHLRGLTRLEWLRISSSLVTDAGLEHLRGLGELRDLYLSGSHVTAEGVERLRGALPNCRIETRDVNVFPEFRRPLVPTPGGASPK